MPAHLWSLPKKFSDEFNVPERGMEVFTGDDVVVREDTVSPVTKEEVDEWMEERGYEPDGMRSYTWHDEWYYSVGGEA